MSLPNDTITGVGDGLFNLLSGGLGSIRSQFLLCLGGKIFATGVRHFAGYEIKEVLQGVFAGM